MLNRRLIPSVFVELDAWAREGAALSEFSPEDVDLIKEWISLKPKNFFRDKSVDEVKDWMCENLYSDLELLKASQRVSSAVALASGVPSETDLEDVYNWVDSTQFTGSPKQVDWAKSIAHGHHNAIALAWKHGKTIPTAASWWIDNRNNIVVNLPL